jgi:hypothetical protein
MKPTRDKTRVTKKGDAKIKQKKGEKAIKHYATKKQKRANKKKQKLTKRQ